jgi:hypothetical protein
MRMTLALVLASLLAAPHGVQAGETAVLTGRVLLPSAGAVTPSAVWVGSHRAAVAPDGAFRAEGLPGGAARIAIETNAGLFVSPTPVTLAPGTTRSVQLALGGRQGTSPPPAPAAEPEKEKKNKKGSFWTNPVAATLIVVGSAIVLGFAVDQLIKSDTTPVSPSVPTN